MKVQLNINKKMIGLIVIIAIIAAVVIAYLGGYLGFKPVVYGSEREASEAITNVSIGIEQIGAIIEDIDRSLGG